ncbi:MAG: [FeFe] hydrogenase H-cluster radical SAM maturase HydE [Candidatus Omnitrophota bacterium]
MPDRRLSGQEIERWLREGDKKRLEELWRAADETRRKHVGDEVHLRGLIEISNYCVRACGYCGLRAPNEKVDRYRMSAEEILGSAREAASYDFGTVVLQAGEDYGLRPEDIAAIVRQIKKETPLAVTLSLGERPREDLELWREAGADRYLLRFETSDAALYEKIHPSLPGGWPDRFEVLRTLRELGYETGSGVMIGIPGQSFASLAADILRFRGLDLDMIGVGPFLPHPNTPLGAGGLASDLQPEDQTPNTELMTYKTVALARLACPEANIPSTTALATLNRASGRELGLMRGANIVMPNVTPPKYRVKYEIYPDKACIFDTARECRDCLKARIESIGRTLGRGPGCRKKSS